MLLEKNTNFKHFQIWRMQFDDILDAIQVAQYLFLNIVYLINSVGRI